MSDPIDPAGEHDGAVDATCLSGRWTVAEVAQRERELRTTAVAAVVDAQAIERLDSAGALVLVRWLERAGVAPAQVHWRPDHRALVDAVIAASIREGIAEPPHHGFRDLLMRIGQTTVGLCVQTRMLFGFIGVALVTALRTVLRPGRLRLTSAVHHLEASGLDAVPLVTMLSFLVGAVVAFLGATVLRDYGAEIFVVELLGFSFLREFGVLLTAIIVAGRTASAFTAQIGTMKSREEIDAIRTLGLDPIELLVLPRLLALLLAVPMLTFGAMIAGVAGGMVVAAVDLQITPDAFLARFHEMVPLRHFLVGMGKAPLYAAVIALIGCLEGFKVAGSAQSVGEHTTSSVVQSISSVIVLDALAAVFFMEMEW